MEKSTKHKPSYLTCRSVSSYDTQQGNNIVYSSRENKEHVFVRYDAEVVGHSAYHYHCPERKNSRLFRVKLRKTYWTNVHSLTKFCLLRSFGRTSANDWSRLKTMNIAHAKRMQFERRAGKHNAKVSRSNITEQTRSPDCAFSAASAEFPRHFQVSRNSRKVVTLGLGCGGPVHWQLQCGV